MDNKSTISLHQKALDFVNRAAIAKLDANLLECHSLLRQAYKKEVEAAHLMVKLK